MLRFLVFICVLVALCGCGASQSTPTCDARPNEGAFGSGDVSAARLSAGATSSSDAEGSGWRDLNGSVVEYEYEDFGGFQLLFCDKRLRWRGFTGAFEGVVAQVAPVISRVADGIYFMSWPTPDGGGDNVVMNLIEMKVVAHLGRASSFDSISGPIHCANAPDCQPPIGEPMAPPRLLSQLFLNAWSRGHLTPGGVLAPLRDPNRPLAPADQAGVAALSGRTLVYETPEDLVRVALARDETRVSIQSGATVVSPTYATLVADGIYYVSWDGEPAGNHVVFNSHNMRVYDQILPGGDRSEAIYVARCFATDGC